jgi:hypothetical protein
MTDQAIPRHTVSLSDEEVFVLRCALERLAGDSDREFVNAVRIANGIESRLPQVPVKWADVANPEARRLHWDAPTSW